MSKKKPTIVEAAEIKVIETKELMKAVASEILYTDEDECLEEIFEKGKEIGKSRNTRDDNQGGD